MKTLVAASSRLVACSQAYAASLRDFHVNYQAVVKIEGGDSAPIGNSGVDAAQSNAPRFGWTGAAAPRATPRGPGCKALFARAQLDAAVLPPLSLVLRTEDGAASCLQRRIAHEQQITGRSVDALGERVTYTSHSLKMLKPCLYSAEREPTARARAHARIPPSRPLAPRRHRRRSHRTPAVLHTDYAVEPGAHSGSQLERMSVAGATALARSIRPRGLAVALRYARAARSQTVLEIDHMAYAVYRAWIAHVGLRGMPRMEGWSVLSRWASACASSGVAPTGGAASLLPMAASHPEPPPQPPAVAGAEEDSSDELSLNLDEVEEDE